MTGRMIVSGVELAPGCTDVLITAQLPMTGTATQ